MSHCATCGAPATGTPFCAQCGTALRPAGVSAPVDRAEAIATQAMPVTGGEAAKGDREDATATQAMPVTGEALGAQPGQAAKGDREDATATQAMPVTGEALGAQPGEAARVKRSEAAGTSPGPGEPELHTAETAVLPAVPDERSSAAPSSANGPSGGTPAGASPTPGGPGAPGGSAAAGGPAGSGGAAALTSPSGPSAAGGPAAPGDPGSSTPGVHDTPVSISALRRPFRDLGVGDYVRDAVAMVLLLFSFGLPWNQTGQVTGQVHVVLATLLSMVSLSLPYLLRGGVLPDSWNDERVRRVRLLANLPYAVVVLLAVVFDFFPLGVDAFADSGIGIGAAAGLAGAVLAAQARTPERPADHADAARWRGVVIGLASLTVVVSLLSLAFALTSGDLAVAEVVALALLLVFFAAVPVLPVLGVIRGDAAARYVLVAVGGAGALACLWQVGAYTTVTVPWSIREVGPLVLFWPALGAAASSAALGARIGGSGSDTARWIRTAVGLLRLGAVVALAAAAFLVAAVIADGAATSAIITVLVLDLLVLVAAVVGRNTLARSAGQGRVVAVVVATIVAVMAMVQASALGAVEITGVELVGSVAVCTLLVIAGTVVGVLTAPATVRADLGPLVPERGAFPTAGAAAATPKSRAYDARTASDPATPLAVLADIAAHEPSLRPYLATNPSTYPDLLEWLGTLGDPEVDAALRRRR